VFQAMWNDMIMQMEDGSKLELYEKPFNLLHEDAAKNKKIITMEHDSQKFVWTTSGSYIEAMW